MDDARKRPHISSVLRVMRNSERRRLAIGNILKGLMRPRAEGQDTARYLIQKNDFGIRMVDLKNRVDKVEMLVTRMYRQRGYQVKHSAGDAPVEESSLRRVTLEVCRDNHTVGTITVSLDSPEGLQAEDLYRDEIAPFRQKKLRLCEFTRLALDVDQCGKEALGCLFHLAFIFAHRIHRATDLFIEVNPRHAVFYRRKLGLRIIGEEKDCRRVQAPAVLLHRDFASISEEVMRYGGLRIRENKSFYSFFMPPWEERELVEEIRGLLLQTQLDTTVPNASATA